MNDTALSILQALDKHAPNPQPTIREIADELETDSTSVVSTWLNILQDAGLITRKPSIARATYLTDEGRAALAHPDQYSIGGPEFTGPRAFYADWEDNLIRRLTVAGKSKAHIAAALNADPRAADRGVLRDENSVRYRQGVLAQLEKSAKL